MSLLVDLIDNDKSRKRWFWHLFKKSFVAFSVFYFVVQTIRHFLDGLALSALWLGNTWFYEVSQDKEALSVSTENLDFWQNFHGAEAWMADALTSTGVFVLQISQPMMVYSNNQVLWVSLAVACLFAVYQLFMLTRYVMSSIEQEYQESEVAQDAESPAEESDQEESLIEGEADEELAEEPGLDTAGQENVSYGPIHPQLRDPVSRLQSEEVSPPSHEEASEPDHEEDDLEAEIGPEDVDLESESAPEPDEVDKETDKGSEDPVAGNSEGSEDYESLYARFMSEEEDDFLDDDENKNSNNNKEEEKK